MASIRDQDRYFSGLINASMPKHLISEGNITRLINGRFIEGAITNAIGFDELDVTFWKSQKLIPKYNITYDTLLKKGDVQLAAPAKNTYGSFLVLVISGVLIQIDLETNIAYDITPNNAFLPDTSLESVPLSYLDNSGNRFGAGAYLCIFNYPNRPIFVNHQGARLSNASAYEMPVSRLGTTGGNRAFVISGDNIMYPSDPLGGASSLAPLSFIETLEPGNPSGFYGQIYNIGSVLDLDYVTCMGRMPRLLGASQDLLAQDILVSTKSHLYVVAAGAPRSSWDSIQFISYSGTTEGIAGPLAITNIGVTPCYITSTGRIKVLSQDLNSNEAMSETYFDEDLGQYACCLESDYTFKSWYRNLDHSHSLVKFVRDRLYATVFPVLYPSVTKSGLSTQTYSHRALAVGSLGGESQVGTKSTIAWEGFYDWFNPVSIVQMENDLYVVAKDKYGIIRFYKENFDKIDEHNTTIITRGYFSNIEGSARSLMKGALYFRKLNGIITVKISYLSNNEWYCGAICTSNEKLMKFQITNKNKTESWSIPLKIEIQHNGCKFELENIKVYGEIHKDDK